MLAAPHNPAASMTQQPFSSYESFESEARRRGFDEVLERSWPPQTVLDTHTHSFGVWAQVSRGEMWLTVGERTQHLLPGAQFTLDPDVPHAERYGADGASYWVARRNARP
jgi:quercetin dioxygenase-like cupin family protein